jgi:hypothetical protein
MKKMLLFVLVPFMSFSQVENQRNFHFELNTSINSTLSFMEGYKSMLGFGVGALVEFRKSSPFRISTGIEFNQTNQGLNQAYSIGKNEPTLISKKAKMSFLTIPINQCGYLGSKQRLMISGGLAIDFMTNVEQTVETISGVESRAKGSAQFLNVSPTAGIGWVFPTEKIQFVIKSDVRLGIFPLFDGGSTGKYGWNHYARIVFGVKL